MLSSLLFPEKCLTINSKAIVVLESCKYEENQQWRYINNYYPYHLISPSRER